MKKSKSRLIWRPLRRLEYVNYTPIPSFGQNVIKTDKTIADCFSVVVTSYNVNGSEKHTYTVDCTLSNFVMVTEDIPIGEKISIEYTFWTKWDMSELPKGMERTLMLMEFSKFQPKRRREGMKDE